jgi:hypothetical protein
VIEVDFSPELTTSKQKDTLKKLTEFEKGGFKTEFEDETEI